MKLHQSYGNAYHGENNINIDADYAVFYFYENANINIAAALQLNKKQQAKACAFLNRIEPSLELERSLTREINTLQSIESKIQDLLKKTFFIHPNQDSVLIDEKVNLEAGFNTLKKKSKRLFNILHMFKNPEQQDAAIQDIEKNMQQYNEKIQKKLSS